MRSESNKAMLRTIFSALLQIPYGQAHALTIQKIKVAFNEKR